MAVYSRREILKAAAVIGASDGVVPLLCTRAQAIAPLIAVAIVLAVGAFVGGLIANANKRNVEAYFMQAILEELQVIHQQLITIQEALAVVLVKLADLPKEISEIVAKESVRTIHAKILGQAQDFQAREMTGFPSAGSDDQASRIHSWLNADAGRALRLVGYQTEIAKLAGELRNSPLSCDPTAAMVLEFAITTEMRLMVLCDMSLKPPYGTDYMRGTAEAYRKHVGRIKDENIRESAAWLKVNSEEKRQQLLASIDRNPLGALLKKSGSAFNCAEVHSRPRPYHNNHNAARIFRLIKTSNFDPLDKPEGQGLLRQIGLTGAQKVDDAPRLLFRQLVFEPPLDKPPSYQTRLVGYIPPNIPPSWTAPWKGGGQAEQCYAGESTYGIPSLELVEQTSKWNQVRFQYSPTADELNRLSTQTSNEAANRPLSVLLDDLNVEEAKIAYAKAGLAAADRSLQSIGDFESYVRRR